MRWVPKRCAKHHGQGRQAAPNSSVPSPHDPCVFFQRCEARSFNSKKQQDKAKICLLFVFLFVFLPFLGGEVFGLLDQPLLLPFFLPCLSESGWCLFMFHERHLSPLPAIVLVGWCVFSVGLGENHHVSSPAKLISQETRHAYALAEGVRASTPVGLRVENCYMTDMGASTVIEAAFAGARDSVVCRGSLTDGSAVRSSTRREGWDRTIPQWRSSEQHRATKERTPSHTWTWSSKLFRSGSPNMACNPFREAKEERRPKFPIQQLSMSHGMRGSLCAHSP